MPSDRPQRPSISPEIRIAALIVVQLCLTMRVYAVGSSSLLMLPKLRTALPAASDNGMAERLRIAMQMLIAAETSLDWHLAQEEARKAVMPILRDLTTETFAKFPELLGAA